VEGNGGSYNQMDDQRFELTIDSNSDPVICTLDRDLAQDDDGLVLVGIDHKYTNILSEQYRVVEPSMLGSAATIGLEHPAVLSIWLIYSFGIGPDMGAHLVPIAVDQEGKRVPVIEKQYRNCFSAPTGPIILAASTRVFVRFTEVQRARSVLIRMNRHPSVSSAIFRVVRLVVDASRWHGISDGALTTWRPSPSSSAPIHGPSM